LVIAGTALEWYDGATVVAVVYIGATVFGGACELLFDLFATPVYSDASCIVLLGASGGVFGLLGGILGLLVLNWQESFVGVAWLCGGWAPLLWRLCFVTVAILVLALEVPPLVSRRSSVAHAAHLFGGLYGLVLSLVAGRNEVQRRWETYLRWSAVIVAVAAAVTASVALILRIETWRVEGRADACFHDETKDAIEEM
jgi:membrane associated rhomboid family serine protease